MISGVPESWQSCSSLSDRRRGVGKLHSLSVNNRIRFARPHTVFVIRTALLMRRPYVDG
jgi:hypothetical protein